MSDLETDRAVDQALEAWTPLDPPADFVDRVLSAHTFAPPAQKRRAWMFAAPVAAAAAVVVVLFVFARTAKDAAAPQATEMAGRGSSLNVVAVNSGSGAGSAAVAPYAVAADAGLAVQTQQPGEAPPITEDPKIDSDLTIELGASVSVHEPAGQVSVRFDFATLCPTGGIVFAKESTRRNTTGEGRTFAVVSLDAGMWVYELRCQIAPSSIAAHGRIRVLHDAAHRRLPPSTPATNDIDVDGRTWRISYQTAVPTIRVRAPGADVLHVASAGDELTFAVVAGVVKVPGATLAEGSYTLWTEANGVKQPRTTTLTIDFDNTAPQIYLSGITSKPGASPIVRGSVQPGWRVSIDGVEVPLGKTLQFEARVRFGRAVIRAEHPQRGIHYYVMSLITK